MLIGNIKLIGIAACAVAAAYLVGNVTGKWAERKNAEIRAAKAAMKRIEEMEKNNENFRNLSAYKKCIAFASDSGFDNSVCDELR